LGEFYLNYAEAIFRYLGSAGTTDNEFKMSACAAVNKVRQRSDVQMPDFPAGSSDDWRRRSSVRFFPELPERIRASHAASAQQISLFSVS
jgi:hypothetical protein